MKLTPAQIRELSEWLDEAIDNMDMVHDVTRQHDGHDEALLWVYSKVVSNSLREMRDCIMKYERHNSQHDKED